MQGFGIRHTLNPNPYTGAFGNDGARYAEDVRDVIATCTPGGVAGFIAETIQGVGGSVPLADGYLPAVYDVRSAALDLTLFTSALCLSADEAIVLPFQGPPTLLTCALCHSAGQLGTRQKYCHFKDHMLQRKKVQQRLL